MVNDSNIITIDSIESKMKVNKFSGNHSQETREGYSIWNYLDFVLNPVSGLAIDKDYENGYITVNGTPNLNYVNLGKAQYITDLLEDGQVYTLWQENYSDTSYGGVYLQVSQNPKAGSEGSQTHYESSKGKKTFTVNKSSYNYVVTLQVGPIATAGTFNNYKNRYMLYKGTDEKTYELPGASPSLDYPSEVKAVGDNVNIFDKDNINKVFGQSSYEVTDNGIKISSINSNEQSICVFRLFNVVNYKGKKFTLRTKWTVSANNKGRAFLGLCNEDGSIRVTNAQVIDSGESLTYTIPDDLGNTEYLALWLYSNTSGTANAGDYVIYEEIKVEEGEEATAYSKYGQGSVEVKKSNNLSNFATLGNGLSSGTYNGLTFEMLNKFSCRISGKPVSSELRFGNNYNSTTILVKLEKNKKYKIKNSLNSTSEITLVNSKNNTYRMVYVGNMSEIPLQDGDDGISSVRVYVDTNKTYDNEIVDCVIYTQEDDDFIPKETEYTLLIQKPMLSGDYFVKEADGWKEVHTFNKKIFDGTENIAITNNGNSFSYIASDILALINNYAIPKLYSNYYIASSWNDRNYNKKANTIGLYNITIGFDQGNLTTADEFKQLLAQKNTEGNPVYIHYPLATPTKLACTEEQITVLNQLQNIILYDDTTNIILPDVYPILDYDVSKIIDTTTTFEASLDSNGYFVVPDYDIKCLVSYSESDIPSMPEAVETAVSVPGRDGDIPLNTTYNPIPFNIVCYTEDNLTPEEKYAEETKMNKFLNSIKNNTIKLKLESKGKYYDVKYNGQLTTINYPKHLQFSIPLKSSSSYAKDIDEYYILGNGEEESDTIKEVGAVFVIEGPAQTPKISLNDYEMFYDNVLLSNTKLVIDSNKSTVTMINREGTATNAMRYYNHEFPKIQNGNNVLKVLSGIDEDRQVNVRWFDLKL